MAREKPKSFLTAFVCLLLLAGAAGMAFVIVVDPYWYFNLATIEGLNARRTEIANELRMVKAHTVCDLKPANVIIGSSRADLALDPEHPGWNQFPGTTYNLALAGIGIGELYYYIRHAYYASGHLRLAVIGLDDLMFNAQREAVAFQTEVLNFDADRLVLSSSESCLGSFFHDVGN